MAGSLNKVILIGNVGKDAEIKSFQSGGSTASFSLATSETWRDKSSGERREKTEWHNIKVTKEGIVGIVKQYVTKGSKVCIEGQLQTRKWQDKSGADRFITEVVVGMNGSLVLLSHKDDAGGGDRSSGSAGGGGSSGGKHQQQNSHDDLDSEIPF